METIINFFRGYVTFKVTGPYPERFLNLCAQRGAGFWDVEWLDGHTLRLTFARRNARRVRRLAEEAGCSLEGEGGRGAPYFLRRFRRRYGFLVGLALSILTACVLSQFILTVEVVGNQRVSTAEILSQLQRQGVKVGAYGPNLKVRQISQRALLDLPEISWLTVNLHGTRAEVLVREKLPKPALREEASPAHVVAEADGIVQRIGVIDGQSYVAEGSAVEKGDILISGIMDLKEPQYAAVDAGQRVVHARGEVWALTRRVLTAKIPLNAPVKAPTGVEDTTWTVVFPGHRVKIFGNSGNVGGKCDKITTTYTPAFPWGGQFPLALEKTVCRGYAVQDSPVHMANAEAMLQEGLLARLEEELGEGGSALSTQFTAEEENGALTVTLRAECREEIGKEVPFPGEVGPVS